MWFCFNGECLRDGIKIMKTLSFVIILLLSAISFAQMGGQSGLTGGGRLSPNVYSGNVTLYDDVQLQCGTDADAAFEWDTAQTQDDLVLGLSGSNTFRITEKADMSVNYGLAVSTNPQICLFSADQTDVNDYFCYRHNQTNVQFLTGTGGFDIQGSIVNTGAGNGGDVLVDDAFRANGNIALTTAASQKFCFQTDCTKYINMTSWVHNGNNTTFAPTATNHEYYFYADSLTDATEKIFMTIGGTQNLGTTATSKLLALQDNSVIVAEIRHDGLIQSDIGFQPVTVTNVTPAEPYACAVGVSGVMIQVNDSNDTAESYMCFCGVDANDATYIWLKVQNPAVNCF
mgnify:CR=1 FL=1